MRLRLRWTAPLLCFTAVYFHPFPHSPTAFTATLQTFAAEAATQTDQARTGLVSSREEGPMEGVLISAKKAGSTLTTTIVSDHQGRYRFPRARLEPGLEPVEGPVRAQSR